MPDNDEWANLLKDHPIFSLPKPTKTPKSKNPLELSTNTLPDFTKVESNGNLPSPSGRRNLMILKDADIIVGAGSEIRMSSFADLKLSPSARKTYKVWFLECPYAVKTQHVSRPSIHRTFNSISTKYL